MQRKGYAAKTAVFPSLRVAPALCKAAVALLDEGESLSGFVEQSIRQGIERRQLEREFLRRGLAARAEARKTGEYVGADAVLERLETMLGSRKRKAKARG